MYIHDDSHVQVLQNVATFLAMLYFHYHKYQTQCMLLVKDGSLGQLRPGLV